MFADYFRSSWRGVLRNRLATLINVGGLALGLAVFLALGFYVHYEFSWDEHWDDAERLHVVAASYEGATGTTPAVAMAAPYVLGDTLRARHPGAFEQYARVYRTTGIPVVDGVNHPLANRNFVDPELIAMLQFETLAGSLAEVLADPRAIALDMRSAERLFGRGPALGQVLSFRSTDVSGGGADAVEDFVVKAIYRLPEPTVLAYIDNFAVLDPAALPDPNARVDLWDIVYPAPAQPGEASGQVQFPFNVDHYFKLAEGTDPSALERDLRGWMDTNRFMDTGVNRTRFSFQKLMDQHLSSTSGDATSNVQRLWIYATIGMLVLLISGCNFVMLATLRLVDRIREVGIRKSAGGGTAQLLGQYLFDAFVHVLLATLLALLVLALLLPKLQVMLQMPQQIQLLTPRNVVLSLAAALLFTIASSLYPAWLSAQTRPGPLLRNGAAAVVGSGAGLRRLLVALQFAIVVVLLLATAVVRLQIDYTLNRDRGFSLDRVIATTAEHVDVFRRTQAILNEFRNVPGVDSASGATLAPGANTAGNPVRMSARADDGSVHEAALNFMAVSSDYFRTLSVPLLAGREFADQLDREPDESASPGATAPLRIVLNAAGARVLGFASPEAALGQLLDIVSSSRERQARTLSARVIGVVGDMQYASVMLPPVPQFATYSDVDGFFAVKLAPGADRAAVTGALAKAWDTVLNGVTPFVPSDTASLATLQLRREEFEARLITGSTLLAMSIALLGLYGLVAATMARRVKEIGVRKVMGANPATIVRLFLLQFSTPIIAASLVAWPIGYWVMKQWLTRFPYQLDTTVIVASGLAASFAALCIAWLTVGVMAARAATVNPVQALRYE